VFDGRLMKELGQMKELDIRILIVEGEGVWTNDGMCLSVKSKWTKEGELGLLLRIQSEGCWVLGSIGSQDTCALLSRLEKWGKKKDRLTSHLPRNPSPSNYRGSKLEHQKWILQGIEGIGPELADKIIRQFNGLPLTWTVGSLDLMKVEGIGAKLAEKIIKGLE
jgi:ERCC4-type nuclease